MGQKTLVLLVQLGSPKSAKVADVKDYLRQFLGNRRVVDLPPVLWKPLLHGLVLPLRSPKSARRYSRIWNGREFPLVQFTNSFAHKVNHYCADNIEVRPCYLLPVPEFSRHLDDWEPSLRSGGKIIIAPQFPQYSEATTASAYDQWSAALGRRVTIPSMQFIPYYHRLKSFIDLSAQKIDRTLVQAAANGPQVDGLILSFHGIALRQVQEKNDPYYLHCLETFELIRTRVSSLSPQQIHCTFQSRFGRAPWLGPSTQDFVIKRITQYGARRLALYAPSFVADCLETLDELGCELQACARSQGGELLLVPCLNDDEPWARAYANYLTALAHGEFKESELCHPPPPIEQSKQLANCIPSPPPEHCNRSTIKVIFFTLFFDLIGFSIIFPLFPALAQYYLVHDREHFLLQAFLQLTQKATEFFSLAPSPQTTVVLFGGLMGSLYSLLQFISAPLWGTLSDRWGRKRVLLLTTAGLSLSYLLWIFSSSFGLLLVARTLGGLAAGNISVATAVIADVTTRDNRAQGMALVGIAFALGFILGPALGGILGQWDLSALYPSSISWGINPFSLPAFLACGLGLFNLFLVAKKLRETHSPRKSKTQANAKCPAPSSGRTARPFVLWQGLPHHPQVNAANRTYFLFICAFAGMEFTLTFLAVERLGYSPLDNACMFVFIGLILALVQGGIVRRKAREVGEKTMAVIGMMTLIPGLWTIAFAQSTPSLYGGLFFLSTGSAMIIPCLTALVSLYAPPHAQGKALGMFRSLGALGRVIGPLAASLLYWQLGSRAAYLWGGVFLLCPLALAWRLPAPDTNADETKP